MILDHTTLKNRTPVHIPKSITFGIRGRRSYEEDPGKIDRDPLAASKLAKMFYRYPDANIFYPEDDHSGIIYTGGPTTTLHAPGNQKIYSTPGDAVIWKRRRRNSNIIALRTKDCVPVLGYDYANRLLFGVHLSNITLIGYKAPADWLGPILDRVFTIVNPTTSYLWLGPAIGGIGYNANGCDCYQYTQTSNQKDGVILIRAIQQHYPKVDLDGFVSLMESNGKLVLNWGHIILSILMDYGIDAAAINLKHNICTLCRCRDFYSHRALTHEPMSVQRWFIPQGIGNISWLAG